MYFRRSSAQLDRIRQVSDLMGNTHELPLDYPIPPDALTEFLREIYGTAVFPGDSEYDAARAEFNTAYSACPKIVVFCICLSDVRACLKLAQDYGLHAVARAGRHSMAGYSVCDGMVIDVSEMNSVVVDPAAHTAVAGAGAQFERLNAHLESHGLHVPGGGCPTVSIAGYMQGGGYSFTSRIFGLNSDNVLSFRMVLADGSLVTASKDRNADLFWAVRGGTGNQFGILLQVVYQLHELDKIRGVRIDWPVTTHREEAARALQTIQDEYIRSDAHPNLGFQTMLGVDPTFNTDLRVVFLGMYTGDDAGFNETLSALTAIPGHQVVKRLHGRYSMVDELLLEGIPALPGNTGLPVKTASPSVKGAVTQSCYLARPLGQDDWAKIIEFAETAPNTLATTDMEAYGGKINSVPADASAFMHRDVMMDFVCDVFWEKDADKDKNVKWHRDMMSFMQQFSNGHSYQNYPCRHQTDWRWAYFGANYPTLVWVKQKYDPTNFFHYQQSITPTLDEGHKDEYAEVLFSDPDIVRDDR